MYILVYPCTWYRVKFDDGSVGIFRPTVLRIITDESEITNNRNTKRTRTSSVDADAGDVGAEDGEVEQSEVSGVPDDDNEDKVLLTEIDQQE
jgi:hypothetical protein